MNFLYYWKCHWALSYLCHFPYKPQKTDPTVLGHISQPNCPDLYPDLTLSYLCDHTEYSSLCYTVGPCCLSILYIVVCIYSSQTPNLSLSHPFPLW